MAPTTAGGRRAGAQDALPIALCIAASSAKVAKLSRAYAIVVGVFHGSVPTARHAGGSRRPMSSAPAAAGAAPATPTAAVYTISDLAREFALTTRAIRFYEDEGLLFPQRRGRVRVYGERERVRIKLILRGKRIGLALSEIRALFDIYALTGNEAAQLSKFLPMLSDRRAMLLQQREDIDAVLSEIAALERDCRRRLAVGGGASRKPATPRPGR
jgi:DNA-binding transcriptional MerR regulator